jgi:hypothetical protein
MHGATPSLTPAELYHTELRRYDIENQPEKTEADKERIATLYKEVRVAAAVPWGYRGMRLWALYVGTPGAAVWRWGGEEGKGHWFVIGRHGPPLGLPPPSLRPVSTTWYC